MYVSNVGLVGYWRELQAELPENWEQAGLRLQFGSEETADRAAALLAPAQPYRAEPKVLRFSAARNGTAAGPDAVERLLSRLDDQKIRGTIELVGSQTAAPRIERHAVPLADQWAEALAGLPPDWSDIYGELEVISTDFVDPASLHCAPMNLRREGTQPVLRFRCAKTFGYGASPGMVARCLGRCDDAEISGSVRVLRVLSDSRPGGTQGPVWLVGGKTV